MKQNKETILYKHIITEHCKSSTNNKKIAHGFIMNITGNHDTALTRQLTEAVKINNAQHPHMNQRHEFRYNAILKAIITNEPQTKRPDKRGCNEKTGDNIPLRRS